jgi:phosphoglucomutase
VAKMKVENIKFDGPNNMIELLGEEMDNKFLTQVKKVSLSPEVIKKHKDIRIIYTPIHGTGVKIIPEALRTFGFTNIINIPEQDVVSGDFPTVISPNPEEEAAMEMALKKAAEVNADVVMATDPDSDRIGVAVQDDKGKYIIINGNQTALLFIYYIITKMKEAGALKGNEYIVKTIVTTELIAEIARKNSIEYFDVYTGFKFIAEIIRELESKKKYIGGGEESFGFMPSDFVRDKDAVSSCALMAEITAWAIDNGKTLYQLLQDIYLEYGYSKEKMKYVVRKGKSGAEEIQQIMNRFRKDPPLKLGGSPMEWIKDFSTLIAKNPITGEEVEINQKISSNVLQFLTKDGTKISVRPSGTEPKIKFYFEVKGELKSRDEFDKAEESADARIEAIMEELGL